MNLNEIKETVAAATSGPWVESSWTQDNSAGVIRADRYGPPLAIVKDYGGASKNVEADAHLIAHAPQWLAELVEDVEGLALECAEARAEVERLRAILRHLVGRAVGTIGVSDAECKSGGGRDG